jgi:hypothetical protein
LSWPTPTFADLRRFCEIDGWEQRRSATGKTGDHHRYKKKLADGRILRTKASHSKDEIGKSLWRHIWNDQLVIDSEDQFWEALRTGQAVDRNAPAGPSKPTLPGWLVEKLLQEVRLPEEQVRELNEEEALARLHEHWSRSAGD